MRTALRFASVIAAAACAGCSAPRALVADDFEPGAKPREQFLKEAGLCEKQAEADQKNMNIGMGPLDPTYSTQNRMFEACMRASGYPRKPPPK